MEDLPLHKISISGPTLGSLLQRFSSSSGDVDGLLFGHVTHVTHITPSSLSDDSPQLPSSSDSDSPQLIATVTSFICPASSPLSFFDSAGRLHAPTLHKVLSNLDSSQNHFLGWLSARRKSPIRPSMREFSVSNSLCTKSDLSFPVINSGPPISLPPCVFLLLTTPVHDALIHTLEYRAYQFRSSTTLFDPKSVDVINIGPAFRGHYESFSPNYSQLPLLNCELRGSMIEDKDEASNLRALKQISKDQKDLDTSAEGFSVGDLKSLVGGEATKYTTGLEDLYEKMLRKIQSLATQVEKSNAEVLQQDNYNRKLRQKVMKIVNE